MRNFFKLNKFSILVFLFSLIGLFVSSKLLTLELHYYKNNSAAFESCQLNGIFNCTKVSTSDYSELFGFPNMILGIVYYTVILVLSGLSIFRIKFPKWISICITLLSFGGALFSIYLMYISLYKLLTICLFCLTSFISSFVILFLTFLTNISNEETTFSSSLTQKYGRFGNWKYKYIIILSIVFLLYSLTIAYSQHYYKTYFDDMFSLKSALLLPINAIKVFIKLIFD